jgi:hypothetical protein
VYFSFSICNACSFASLSRQPRRTFRERSPEAYGVTLATEAQRQELVNYLNGVNWRIIGEFTEVESGEAGLGRRVGFFVSLNNSRLNHCAAYLLHSFE